MRSLELAKRNLIEVWRDPLSLGLTVGLPILMLVVFQALSGVDDIFKPRNLAPGVVLFGFVMLMFSAAMALARDRETALFSRLLTTPLRPNELAAAYSLPYLPVAIVQAVLLYAIAAIFGPVSEGGVGTLSIVLLIMAVLYIGLGMIVGVYFTLKQVPFVYMVILLLTIFGGAWMDINAIGGAFKTVGNVFPFAHALDAARDAAAGEASFGSLAGDIAWVVVYAMVVAVLAVVLFKRRMQE